jgi:hypothetical protein
MAGLFNAILALQYRTCPPNAQLSVLNARLQNIVNGDCTELRFPCESTPLRAKNSNCHLLVGVKFLATEYLSLMYFLRNFNHFLHRHNYPNYTMYVIHPTTKDVSVMLEERMPSDRFPKRLNLKRQIIHDPFEGIMTLSVPIHAGMLRDWLPEFHVNGTVILPVAAVLDWVVAFTCNEAEPTHPLVVVENLRMTYLISVNNLHENVGGDATIVRCVLKRIESSNGVHEFTVKSGLKGS